MNRMKALLQLCLITLVTSMVSVARAGVTYYHVDTLGSPAVITDSSGTVISRSHYKPFGDSIEGVQQNIGYTGHAHDGDLGLTYMQARYYDPVIGRFLQTDPVGYEDQMNLYAYVGNDPMNMVDPTGMTKSRSCGGRSCKGGGKPSKNHVAGAAKDFARNFKDMRDANTIGADKYFHCKANCEASQRGDVGEKTAEVISDTREATDQVKNWIKGLSQEESAEDSKADQEANEQGREQGSANPDGNCKDMCSNFRPETLDEKY